MIVLHENFATANAVQQNERIDQFRENVRLRQQQIETLENRLQSFQGSDTAPVSQFANFFTLQSRRPGRHRPLASFDASFRLSQLMASARDTRLGQSETGDPVFRRPDSLPSKIDAFANVGYSDVENDANGAGYESRSWQGTVGVDYRLRRNLAVGVFTSFTSNDSETGTIDSESESFSYLVGPFFRYNLTPSLTVSGSLSAGSTDTDLRVGTATSSFDSTQKLATLGLKGSWSEGAWTITPSAGISYSITETEGFIDSAGNATPENTSRSGAVNAGPTVSYTHVVPEDGALVSVQPSLGIQGTWNYKHSGDTRFNNGVILTSDDLSASLTPAVTLGFFGGASVSLAYTRSGIFSDLDGWAVSAGANLPLTMLWPGFGESAQTSFQFAAAPHAERRFLARVTIPLY